MRTCPETQEGWNAVQVEARGFGGTRRGGLHFATRGSEDVPPPRPLPDDEHAGAAVIFQWPVLPQLRAQLDARAEGSHGRIDALALEAEVGPVYGWVGRRAPFYGAGRGGGLVLSGTVPLDGVGAGLARPLQLPWIFKRLGHGDFELFLARASDNGDIGRPWLLAGRGVVAPNRSVALGVTRGMMFGGEGSAEMSARHFFEMLAGAHPRPEHGPWPAVNQIAAFDLVWTPRPAGVPIALFLEWGMEDNSGAWVRSPGIISGVEVVHPEGSRRIGLERTYLSRINGHGIWYRHFRYRSGWSDAGRPLGHPLAGPGTEWLLHGAAHGDHGRWDLELGLRTRHRLPENSLSPSLQGRSSGGFLNGWVRTGPVDLYVQMDGERTRSGTDVLTAEAGIRWRREF